VDAKEPLVFSHGLDALIGGQLAAGLTLLDLYEDGWPERLLGRFTPTTFATCASKDSAALGTLPR